MANENLESKRWLIAIGAIVMQLCLGTVYAWSVFKKPLMGAHGWLETPTQMTFMIFMFMVGCAAAFGGTLVDKKGPKFVATVGGILFGTATLLSGLADQVGNLYLLYIAYGVIGGLGNGFCYVTPIATLIRWFPDKRGLVTGLAVMGFGFGAFFMGKIAPPMIAGFKTVDPAGVVTSSGVANTFYIWGIIFLVLVVGAAQLFKNPPKGWLPAGFTPSASTVSAADSCTFDVACKTPQWWMLWGMLFLNVSAGLGLISQLSPMAQDMYRSLADTSLKPEDLVKVLAAAGGSVVAYSAIFNGLGRLFWARVSDTIGRKSVFAIMFASQAVIYALVAMGVINGYYLFLVAACYLLACYGGGFATMPAFCADSFGPGYIGKCYGFMLTAWACAGIVGPLVFAKLDRSTALYVASGLLVVGLLIAISYKSPVLKKAK